MDQGSEVIATEPAPKRNWRQAKKAKEAAAPVELTTRQRESSAPNLPPGRVWLVLEENDNIPRGGQFFGYNGAAFVLKPGVKANVPIGILNILNDAVEHVPVVDPQSLTPVDWRKKLRYPYRIVTEDHVD